jgi:hypothetical protein
VRRIHLPLGPLGSQRAGNSTFFSGLFVRDSGRVEVMGHDMSRMLRNLELKAGENFSIEERADELQAVAALGSGPRQHRPTVAERT